MSVVSQNPKVFVAPIEYVSLSIPSWCLSESNYKFMVQVVVKKDVPDGPSVVQLQSRWKGLTLETLQSACEYLATADAKLAPLIQLHGIPDRLLVKGPGAFATLSKSICFQQLATAAAAKIFARVLEACGCTEAGILDYSSVLNAPHEALCAAGLSRNKASYLHDLACHFQDGHLSDEIIMELDTQGLHTSLTKVRGLGPWSVDMFAMFHLGLPDVLPVGDLGVRRGMQALYGLKSLPTPSQMEAIASSWQPWRSVGSYFMWRVDTSGLLKPPKRKST